MSQSQPSSPARSPYPRHDYWGSIDDDQDDRAAGHAQLDGTDKWQHVAWEFLMRTSTPVCGRTGIELSDPSMYLPKLFEDSTRSIEYGQHRHRRRINEETGFINWGETTSTELDPRPKDEFLEVVDCVLDWIEESRGFSPGTDHRGRVRMLALREKEAGRHDVAVLADVFRCIEDPDQLDDYGY